MRQIGPRVVLGILGFGLMGICAVAMAAVWAHAPAFSPDLRRTGISGDWRVATGSAHFDAGAYLFQIGYGFGTADALGLETGVTRSAAQARDHATQARSALTAALHFDPANGHAWQRLSEARAVGGDVEGARLALRRSWALAPHTPDLALARTYLLEGLAEIETLTPEEIAIAASDRALLARHRPKSLADLPGF